MVRKQFEITEAKPLLDEKGDLLQAGWARKLLPIYNKKLVQGGKARLKEWDYYYIGNQHYGVALTIADNSYMGLDSISFLSFDGEPWEITKSPMRVWTMLKTGLPETSTEGATQIEGKGYLLKFEVKDGVRKLTAHMDNFRDKEPIDVDLTLTDEPEDSIVICTPFPKKGHFYYNQKINCMKAEGSAMIGNDFYKFNNENESRAVLDWGRGVWTYHNTWYWGSASGVLNGEELGWNIGYGFGDTSAASENAIFYKGKIHKLSEVRFRIPKKLVKGKLTEDYMLPWKFISNDGRFEMDFVPVLDRASCTDVKLIKSDQHQVFGHFSGTVTLDDGTVLKVNDLFGFAEKVENKW